MVKVQQRAHMPPSRRAKQFAPFQALKGLNEAIAAKENRPQPRKELAEYAIEQINSTLLELRKGQQITVIYYGNMEQAYLQVTGKVVKVDAYWKILQIDTIVIDFTEISEIIP